jgi:hypothetical protein
MSTSRFSVEAFGPGQDTTVPREAHLPLTRCAALRRWKGAILSICAAQLLVTLAAAVFSRGAISPGESLLLDLDALYRGPEAIIVTILLLGMTTVAEHRFLRRPPRSLLGFQFSLFLLGTAAEATADLRLVSGSAPSEALLLVAHGALLAGLLAIGAWFVATSLVVPSWDALSTDWG